MSCNPSKCKELTIKKRGNCDLFSAIGMIPSCEEVDSLERCAKQFGSMLVLEEAKTMVYVTNHNMITMAMVIFKTYKMADKGQERVLTKILVYSYSIEPFICLFVAMNWEVP